MIVLLIVCCIRQQLERIQAKLQKKSAVQEASDAVAKSNEPEEFANSDDERKQAAQDKLYRILCLCWEYYALLILWFIHRNSIKAEIKSLKRQMKSSKDSETQGDSKKQKSEEVPEEDESNEVLKDFHEQQKKYAAKKTTLPAKGTRSGALLCCT